MITDPPAHDLPLLSVVICTYNRSHLLQGCIEAIGEQLRDARSELVVVDDGSSDRTQAVIDASGVQVVRGGWRENRGLNAARNEGLRLASAPIVLFFDDDQVPPDGYLAHVIQTLDEDLDGVGGPLRDRGGGLRTCSRCSLGDSTLGGRRRLVDRLIGGNMALRARSFVSVGLFDERLSGRGDETEWFLRASGLRFLYEPELWVWHRRDSFGVVDLCRYAFRQGKAAPTFEAITAGERRRRVPMMVRYLGHALRHRCSHGLELACRELGAMFGGSRMVSGGHGATDEAT